MSPLFDCRDAFASALETAAREQPNIVTVVNDSIGSSKISNFATLFPNRLVNVGIAEQDLIGIAAGLANGGLLPFVCAASCFMTGRGLEQIKADVAYSNVNVKLCGMSSGMAYGELGHLERALRRDVADAANDDVRFDPVALPSPRQPVQHRLHHPLDADASHAAEINRAFTAETRRARRVGRRSAGLRHDPARREHAVENREHSRADRQPQGEVSRH